MKLSDARIRALKKRAEAYFANQANRPFSMQEACLALGVDYAALCGWETGDVLALAGLAREIRARVAAGWEKGDVPSSLAALMIKTYARESGAGAGQPVEIIVRVLEP